MTKEEKLKGAIEKAVKNGWATHEALSWSIAFNERPKKMTESALRNVILFDPEWAKAFFGKHRPNLEIMAWEYHQHKLLDLIQEDKDPIEYLEQFLD